MRLTEEQIFSMCDVIAPKHLLDASLIKAICLQECERNKDGTFAPDIIRLEQNYYRRYVKPLTYQPSTKAMLSASYGVMQMMGLSLLEIGYLNNEVDMKMDLDKYVESLELQIEWGCRWFLRKLRSAKGDIAKALCYWNGDMTGRYAEQVLERQRKILLSS